MEKLARKRDSTQKSIPFKRMYADGVCELEDNVYNSMIEFGDINYELLDEQEKKSLLKQYEKFINFFDTSISHPTPTTRQSYGWYPHQSCGSG